MDDARIPHVLLRAAFFFLALGAAWLGWNGSLDYSVLFGTQAIAATHVVGTAVIIAAFAGFFCVHRTLCCTFVCGGAIALAIIFVLRAQSSEWQFPSVLSQGIRTILPWVLMLAIINPRWPEGQVRFWCLLGIALTFAGHGIKALGWPEATPEIYYQLIGGCLGLGEAQATAFLRIFGMLDMLAVAALAIPAFRRTAFGYMAGWGLITALARPWAAIATTGAAQGVMAGLPEFFFRAPHFLLPAMLLLAVSAPVGTSRKLDISGLS